MGIIQPDVLNPLILFFFAGVCYIACYACFSLCFCLSPRHLAAIHLSASGGYIEAKRAGY